MNGNYNIVNESTGGGMVGNNPQLELGWTDRIFSFFFLLLLSPFAPENLVSRDRFGHPGPRPPPHSRHLTYRLV